MFFDDDEPMQDGGMPEGTETPEEPKDDEEDDGSKM